MGFDRPSGDEMKGLALIPWATTDWTDSKRLFAGVPMPLNEAGAAQAHVWGEQLCARDLQAVYSSAEQTSRETADAVALTAKVKVKPLAGFEEVGVGLWEGLTEDALKARFPKVYKRWREDPSAICPPEGEALAEAAARLKRALHKTARKLGAAPVAVVLGPVACAVTRCVLENVDLARMRELLTTEPVWYPSLAASDQSLVSTAVYESDANATT